MWLRYWVATIIAVFAVYETAAQDSQFLANNNSPLLQPVLDATAGDSLERWGIHLAGWSNASFTASNRSGELLPYGFNYRGNEFQLQQNWLRFDWRTDNDKNAGFGFHSDVIIAGTDYRFTVARGLYDKQLTDDGGTPAQYGIDPVQLYAQLQLPHLGDGFELKLGRFYSLLGFESIDSTRNLLATRSYTLVYNPLTHTGGVATLKVNETLSVSAGLVTGSDIFFDAGESLYFISNMKWNLLDGATLSFSTILGKGQYDVEHALHNPQIFNLSYTQQLGEQFTWRIDGLYGFTDDVRFDGMTDWYGLINSLTTDLSESVAATVRVELFNDADGQRTGHAGLYTAVSSGLIFSPYPWLLVRPEVRFDHHRDQPFNDRSNLFTGIMDVIVRW